MTVRLRKRFWLIILSLTLGQPALAGSLSGGTEIIQNTIINVPADFPTIQAAIDAAANNDTVLVAPGTYPENLVLENKTVVLTSRFLTTGDSSDIELTILDGGGGESVITIDQSVGRATAVIGFTIQNAENGILPTAKFDLLNCIIRDCVDGVDYESGSGGLCKSNIFENNDDDGIDLDLDVEIIIEDNIIRNNDDDGIEIRLQPYNGPILNTVIRRNVFLDNGEDGIQFIDYNGWTARRFLIERNLIIGSAFVGIGLMGNQNTRETREGASIPERILVINNTFVANDFGLTGGDSLVALNNLFLDHPGTAIKKVDGTSTAAYNLFWNNGTDIDSSNVDSTVTFFTDPLLTSEFELASSSPAIDAGVALFIWEGDTVLNLASMSYSGSAPDLGAIEFEFVMEPPQAEFSATPVIGEVPFTVSFTDESTGEITNYGWDFGDGGTSTEANPLHQYETVGVYTVSLMVSGPGGSDTETKVNYIIANEPTAMPPDLLSPEDGSSGVSITPTLNWRSANAALRYRVQVATDAEFSSLFLDESAVVDTSLQLTNLDGETTYFWRVNSNTGDGISDWSEVWSFTTEIVSTVDGSTEETPNRFTLHQNYPNPFNPTTTITFDLPEDSFVTLRIYNARGQEVATLVSKQLNAGQHRYDWQATGMASGVYFCRLQSGDLVNTRKMLLVQ